MKSNSQAYKEMAHRRTTCTEYTTVFALSGNQLKRESLQSGNDMIRDVEREHERLSWASLNRTGVRGEVNG